MLHPPAGDPDDGTDQSVRERCEVVDSRLADSTSYGGIAHELSNELRHRRAVDRRASTQSPRRSGSVRRIQLYPHIPGLANTSEDDLQPTPQQLLRPGGLITRGPPHL